MSRSEPIDPMGTAPLFEIPEVYRAPKRRADQHVSKWSKFVGHATCDICILNVHDGISDTPLSRAKHSYVHHGRRWLLCNTHATQTKAGERSLP